MDPNPIQPVTTSVIANHEVLKQSPPPDPKPDKGIPVFILVILFVVVIGSLFLFRYILQKSTDRPVNTTNINLEPITNNQELLTPPITPTPTARLTGPGQYACSALGGCKDWDPQILKENCTVTFADRNCLDQCSDTTKRCKI
ncbi:TPA: hypothetical protein DHT69_00875 [Candidatus Collierbacteria bacterium]|nr:hypothetical protein [Candidatus Collierbacteria bacterium]